MSRLQRPALQTASTPAERGWMIIDALGCESCHQKNSSFRAPVLTGLYGRTVHFNNGSEGIADASYIKESLLAPKAKIVTGYQGIMPSYEGKFTEAEFLDILEAMRGVP